MHPTGPFPPPRLSASPLVVPRAHSAWVVPLRVQIIYPAASISGNLSTDGIKEDDDEPDDDDVAHNRATNTGEKRRRRTSSTAGAGFGFGPNTCNAGTPTSPHSPIPLSLQHSPSHRPRNTPSKASSLHISRLLDNRIKGLPNR